MPNADFSSPAIVGRTILPTDYIFGATPGETDLQAAAKTDLLSAVIETMFRNAPDPSTATAMEMATFRAFAEILSSTEVTAEAVAAALARFTDDEKDKLGTVYQILDAGRPLTQNGATFIFNDVPGYSASVGFQGIGQFIVFEIGTIAVVPTTADDAGRDKFRDERIPIDGR